MFRARAASAGLRSIFNAAIAALFTEVMSQCRALEAPLTVAYLGPEGTFTEAAALKRFGSAIQKLPCANIDEVFHAAESGAAHYGVIPVENSTEGAVGRTLEVARGRVVGGAGEGRSEGAQDG